MITFEDILLSRERIKKYIYNTPLDFATTLSNENTSVFLKLECQQRTKSFKVRGAFSKLTNLNEEQKKLGVITASSGNHGAGLSYAGNVLLMNNIEVFVPKTAPRPKLEKIKYYGGKVFEIGKNYDETHKSLMNELLNNNKIYVDSSSDVDVIAGQGTIGLEILEQYSDIDTIVVPIGGGGIITGIAIAAKKINPKIKIIGVQTDACPAMVASLKDNIMYEEYPSKESLCDSLIGGISEIPFKMAKKCIDDIIVVSENTIKMATMKLLLDEKVVAEPSSAATVAALMENSKIFKGKKVALIITGGNIENSLLKNLINKEENYG